MTSPILITTVLFGTLLAAACFYRYRQIRAFPLGFGWSQLSSDGRFIAHATEFEDVSFFGRRTWCYEFEIVNCEAKRPVASIVRLPTNQCFVSSESRIHGPTARFNQTLE